MAILNILIGAALLFFGRKVFWLFIAGVGFIAGMTLASNTFNGPDWLSLAAGLALGLIAALLAIFVQHFAIGLAGFLAGGYIAMQLVPLLNLDGGGSWVAFIVGGILGVILVNAILDWALIILSTLAGASLLVDAISIPQVLSVIAFIALLVAGISVQAKDLKKEK